jgi:hypothetical protein
VGREHEFLDEAVLLWMKMTIKGLWCEGSTGSIGGGSGDGWAVLGWSWQGERGSERAMMNTFVRVCNAQFYSCLKFIRGRYNHDDARGEAGF